MFHDPNILLNIFNFSLICFAKLKEGWRIRHRSSIEDQFGVLGGFLFRRKQNFGSLFVRTKGLKPVGKFPLVNETEKVTVNGTPVVIPQHLNCKDKNVIYMWICRLCGTKETYFGRTIQECHDRTSGHRNCFSEEKWEKSALSMHAKETHQMDFSLNLFTISLVKKVSPQQIRREEFKFIDKYKTNSRGLNRYKS